MRKYVSIFGLMSIIVGLILLIGTQTDAIGIWNKWQHLPKAEMTEENKPSQDKKAAENPYLADIKRWNEANKDVCSWIHIDQVLSDPVVQGSDNTYYLDHDATSAYNPNGAAFIDYEVPFKKADNIVIYGHNMDNTQVFSNLNKYLNKDFGIKNNKMTFASRDSLHQYELISVHNMNLRDKAKFFSFNTWLTWHDNRNAQLYIEHMLSSVIYKTGAKVQEKDHLMTLSTCDNSQADARIILVWKRISDEQ